MKRQDVLKKEHSDHRKECEEIWAKNKYLVLSKSQKIYKEIREYLKNDNIDISHLSEQIDAAKRMKENRGECVNAFYHIWGYFKKDATTKEKNTFFCLIEAYLKNEKNKADLISFIKSLLLKYPNDYIKNSTLMENENNETMA